MSGTELITGMEDIVQHIKDLEIKNKKLQAEWEILNDFCPEEAENNGQAVVDWICKFFTTEDKMIELEKENKELKEQNKILHIEYHELNDIAAERGSHNEALEEEKSAMKEALAEKFYKHYDDMGYNKLNIARTIGPDLGRMVDHLIEENKKLQEENKNLQDEEDKYEITEENIIRDYGDESEQVKKLKEQVKYWKNFALFYWSGFQLGEEENSDSDVWQEALDQCNSNSECDTEALTKKCMED